ncbi:MAG: hypothetical protein ACRC2T_06575, partial [Thermoguttaceae bacterium]
KERKKVTRTNYSKMYNINDVENSYHSLYIDREGSGKWDVWVAGDNTYDLYDLEWRERIKKTETPNDTQK